ncbi:MAG TPA: serpin family protein [Solirubrobacteraceae bacterium]|nr:serpin family protein [Solirubrobacteraceae bacterium]
MIPARPKTSLAVALATILAALAGCGAAATKPVEPSPGPPTRIAGATHAGEELALALLRRLGQAGGNVVFSPYGIESAIAMLSQGARGATAAEIARVLHTRDPAGVGAGVAATDAQLTAAARAPNAPRLHLASGLWVQSGLRLRTPFMRTLATLFGAPPQVVDFSHRAESARHRINAWIAARTGHLIADLFPAGTITNRTAAVLANAVYLAAHWAHPFTRALTVPGPFYPTAEPVVKVPFMTQTPIELAYARGPGYRAVDLPYRGSTLSMLLVMPAPGTLARFEQGLSGGALDRLARELRPTRVDLHLPRFELTFDTALNEALSALGMPLAFSDGADFSGITSETRLTISAVEHAATLKVDEAGTVAAAATGIALEPSSATTEPATLLTLDHPFLAFLRDSATGAILFAAQVANPA